MFCPNCGKDLPDHAKFCNGCGNAIKDEKEESYPKDSYYNPQPKPVQPKETQTQPQIRQGEYKPATFSQSSYSSNESILSIGSYIGIMIISAIPIVGFIMLLVWSFSSNVNMNKKNFAIAMLVMGIVMFIITLLILFINAIMLRSMY